MLRRRDFLRTFIGSAGLMGYLQAAGAKLPQSRISAITIHRLSQKLQQPISYCCRSGVSTQGATIIEVRTDDGLTGWGDGARDAEILRANRDRVIGRSPFEVEAIFDELGGFTHDGSTAGGFDVALWDIIGKALDKPIYELLGKPYRTRVMPYASAGYRKDWPDLAEGFAEEIRHWTHDVGFRAAKMKTGYDPETDAEVIGAVRKAIGPHIRLGIDSGTPGAYDDATAVRLGKKLEECNLEFWEEPIDKYDLAGYAQLKNSLKIPLASGEALPVDWVMKNYVQGEVVDIVQPDINTTGLTGGRRFTYLCWLHNVRLMPHSWGTPIRIASEMHWMACCPPATNALNPPPLLFELHLPHESPVWNLTKQKIEVDKSDGCIEVPKGPGLGIEIDRGVLESFRTGETKI